MPKRRVHTAFDRFKLAGSAIRSGSEDDDYYVVYDEDGGPDVGPVDTDGDELVTYQFVPDAEA